MTATWHVLQVGFGKSGGSILGQSHRRRGSTDRCRSREWHLHNPPSPVRCANSGFEPAQITDVIISHHHPDHTINIGMFPNARVHDHWAVYHYDTWDSRPAEGFLVSPSVLLWETPGHTPQDITTLVGTSQGLVAFTHLWFRSRGLLRIPTAPIRVGSIEAGRGSWKWPGLWFRATGQLSFRVPRRRS